MTNVTNPVTPATPDNQPAPFDRILAIDLRSATKDQMAALTSEAIRRGCPLSKLLGEIIVETSRRILAA